MDATLLLADAAQAVEPFWERLTSYGVLGITFAVVITLFVYPYSQYWKRSLERREMRDEKNQESNLSLVDTLKTNDTYKTTAIVKLSELMETTHGILKTNSVKDENGHTISHDMIEEGFKKVLESLDDLKNAVGFLNPKLRPTIERIESEVAQVQKNVG